MSEDAHTSGGFLPPEEKITAIEALEYEITVNFKEGHSVALVKHHSLIHRAMVSLEFLACLGNVQRGTTYNWEKRRYE